uniref:Uncharacterized protein n=1 Tax=Siphoviridae sp. ctjOC2 TaxID=2825632 RepID=A0A8S5Q7X6_9CAUD|nr:MAG TPA: hypothetical protein [Siphoviridae sp. ctjOC2]DAV09274.1 MAG TPA: hypothetical protein [Caudoviricetes sp.]
MCRGIVVGSCHAQSREGRHSDCLGRIGVRLENGGAFRVHNRTWVP